MLASIDTLRFTAGLCLFGYAVLVGLGAAVALRHGNRSERIDRDG